MACPCLYAETNMPSWQVQFVKHRHLLCKDADELACTNNHIYMYIYMYMHIKTYQPPHLSSGHEIRMWQPHAASGVISHLPHMAAWQDRKASSSLL